MEMDDFQREVIDRLARIEETNKYSANTAATVLAQGLRIDALEKRLAQFKDRMWGCFALFAFVGVPVLTYLRVQLFGAFTRTIGN